MSVEIEQSFKADLSGWLEHEQKHAEYRQDPNETTQSFQNLLDTFSKTLEYHGNSNVALESLHAVVFQALVNREDFETDFNVPPFEKGMNHELFYKLSRHFDLFRFTCYALWLLPGKDAVEFIMLVSQHATEPIRGYHTVFIRLAPQHELNNEQVATWLAQQLEKEEEKQDYIQILLRQLYDCFRLHIRDTTTKMTPQLTVLHGILRNVLQVVPVNVDIIFQVKIIYQLHPTSSTAAWMRQYMNLNPKTKLTARVHWLDCEWDRQEKHALKQQWEQLLLKPGTLTERQKTFFVICDQLRDRSFNRLHVEHADPDLLTCIQNIEDKIYSAIQIPHHERQKRMSKDYKDSLLWCCFALKHRPTFWKSALLLMTQFIDLWLPYIDVNESEAFFINLLAKENMLPHLYDHLTMQIIRCKDKALRDSSFYRLFHITKQCIHKTQNIDQILSLRDHVFEESEQTLDAKKPSSATDIEWRHYFDTQLTRVSNQMTSLNDDQNKDAVKQLAVLSLMWPYKVLETLFLSCVNNAKRYQAVNPILQKLGKLCRLKKKGTDQDPLLIMAMKESISSLGFDDSWMWQDNAVEFIMDCLYQEYGREAPLIATKTSSVTQFLGVLNFQDFFKKFVNVYLEDNLDTLNSDTSSSDTLTGSSLVMSCLNEFCNPNLWQKKQLSEWISVEDPPVIFELLTEKALLSISKLAFPYDDSRPTEMECAFDFIKMYVDIASYMISNHYIPQQVSAWYNQLATESDWLIRILWLKLVQSMDSTHQLIPVHKTVYEITGDLNGSFRSEDIDDATNEEDFGWRQLFSACALSTEFSDILCKNIRDWKQPPHQFYEAPANNKLLRTIRYELANFAYTEVAYGNLLKYFVPKLYDILELRNNFKSYVNQPEAMFVDRLTDEETKSYFILLIMVELLKYDGPSAYGNFTCNVTTIVQELANWSEISAEGQVNNCSQLKKKIPNEGEPTAENGMLVYYPPLLSKKQESKRALCVLVIYHLCLLLPHYKDNTYMDTVYRLILLVLEGLIDKSSRQQFQNMLRVQPKHRRNIWKKRQSRVFFQMRPVLLDDESKLILPVIERQDFQKSAEITKILESSSVTDQKLYII